MTPTAAGRHCAACQTEVVDFTRLTEAEVVAYLAARQGQRVCGFMAAPPAVPCPAAERKRGPGRWLLAVAAFLGGHSPAAAATPPQLPPLRISLFKRVANRETVVIRGVVLDDSLGVPVPGAHVFVAETRYGAVANERGEFTLTFAAGWAPVKSGVVKLRVAGMAFALAEQVVEVDIRNNLVPAPLTVRLRSIPERGHIVGEAVLDEPPLLPPTGEITVAAGAAQTTVVVRGVVLDDSLNAPVQGAWVFVNGTRFGAVTNEKGEFMLSFRPNWAPIKSGIVTLEISSGYFTFKPQNVQVIIKDNPSPAPLIIRLSSLPERGNIKGKIHLTKPPVPPPGSRKALR